MKRSVMTIAAIGTLIAAPAFAADMALKAPPPQPPAWTWTGCYVGIEGGGVLGHDPVVATAGGTSVTTISSIDGLVGGTFGCNYQFSQFVVVGVEDDISWTGLQGTASDLKPFNTTFSHSVSSTWLDTLRARAGVVFGGGGFLYATGGAAFAGIQDSAAGAGAVVSSTTNVTGWTVGGGVEFMPWLNWSLKVEYLFVQFPTIADAFNTFPPVGNFVGVNTHLSENIIRAGINWHFNWPAPLAARY
jgi:outer membrane immunogenic protein